MNRRIKVKYQRAGLALFECINSNDYLLTRFNSSAPLRVRLHHLLLHISSVNRRYRTTYTQHIVKFGSCLGNHFSNDLFNNN